MLLKFTPQAIPPTRPASRFTSAGITIDVIEREYYAFAAPPGY